MREHREREYRDNVCYCAVTVTWLRNKFPCSLCCISLPGEATMTSTKRSNCRVRSGERKWGEVRWGGVKDREGDCVSVWVSKRCSYWWQKKKWDRRREERQNRTKCRHTDRETEEDSCAQTWNWSPHKQRAAIGTVLSYLIWNIPHHTIFILSYNILPYYHITPHNTYCDVIPCSYKIFQLLFTHSQISKKLNSFHVVRKSNKKCDLFFICIYRFFLYGVLLSTQDRTWRNLVGER